MQTENHIFTGLRRDNHQIKQLALFLWDAHNVRLTNREDSTLLSITNERGTGPRLYTYQGHYVGHCVLGKYLVVFTANEDKSGCRIYRTEYKDGTYETVTLFYKEDIWEKGWTPEHPIETLGNYETELVLKVYWVDGINQARYINISKPELIGITYNDLDNLTDALSYKPESFNFILDLDLKEGAVQVKKKYGEGIFAPGVILYAFTYYNKYGAESNIFEVTPLLYISPEGRGEDADKSVSNSFLITIPNVDRKYDYLRIYSIQRTSLDAEPIVKRIADISIPEVGNTITYIDNGTTGDIVDANYLLYVGGENIIPNTLAAKDGTLFMGNYNLETDSKWSEIKKAFKEEVDKDTFGWIDSRIASVIESTAGKSYYTSPEILAYSPGFKTNEEYRCGVLFQSRNGKWSPPIFLKDTVLCDKYPEVYGLEYIRHSKVVTFPLHLRKLVIDAGYVRARACVVFPSLVERDIICLGVICPTVYNVKSRKSSSPYAQSSWFFRPILPNSLKGKYPYDIYAGTNILFANNKPLYQEVQSMLVSDDELQISDVEEVTDPSLFQPFFFADENLVTFNSPDLEFNTDLQANNSLYENSYLSIIGILAEKAVSGDIEIITSSSALSESGGFEHYFVRGLFDDYPITNGGLVDGGFYRDLFIHTRKGTTDGGGDPTAADTAVMYFLVYPWQRSGSLNNDIPRSPELGTRTSVLKKKVISNLKFFSPSWINNTLDYSIETPILFNSDQVSIVLPTISYLDKALPYMGNVETAITTLKEYPFWIRASQDAALGTIPSLFSDITKTKDPVSMKYKSSPHLVFSLRGRNGEKYLKNTILLIPRADDSTSDGTEYKMPEWVSENKNNIRVLDLVDNYSNHKSDDGIRSPDFLGSGGYWYLPDTKQIILELFSGTLNNSGAHVYIDVTPKLNGAIICIKRDRTYLVNSIPGILNVVEKGYHKGEDIYLKVKYNDVTSDCELSVYLLTDDDLSNVYTIKQDNLSLDISSPYMFIGDIRRPKVSNKFGGDAETANNLWLPAGGAINIEDLPMIAVSYLYGDTWFERYDCLKTYPFTNEDENQIVEIGSFLLETRYNIDGRTDRNRGKFSNLNMSPVNFNLMNDVYSLLNNFFNYRILDEDYYKSNKFSNQVLWSKEKVAGEEVDTWTNVTLANTLDMNGDRGEVTALRVFNDNLLCFQLKALSRINFNSRVQIPTSDGVPVEISNSYKVDGYTTINDSIGCQNKWSIVNTPSGIYFQDLNKDNIYLFNGLLANVTLDSNMSWWVRKLHTENIWSPLSTLDNNIRSFYDNRYSDVYFTPGLMDNQEDALCFSEQLGQFTSFMSYGGTLAMFNFADGFFSLRLNNDKLSLYLNHMGLYNNFFGETKPWDFSFISNDNPTVTKVFDTLEIRADSFGPELLGDKYTTKVLEGLPFDFIRVSNEYLDTEDSNFDASNLRKKFRIWRALLPRANRRERIRNPWTMITLGCKNPGPRLSKVHDITVKYTI